jgi:hypothetical protein
MQTQMLGVHQSTYDAIFQHPISRNLVWRDVRSMLGVLADVTEEHAEHVKFTRNGQTLTLHPPRRKDFSDIDELMRIRHFLERSGAPSQAATAEGMHLLVVIDHREARVFKAEIRGSVPRRITPYDPQGAHRHLRNVENDANGQRKPELKSFYEAVARTLEGAEKILILGSATGSSSAMDHLVAELKERHPDISRRVVGAIAINEQHMSENQLLEKAREFYTTAAMRESDSRQEVHIHPGEDRPTAK